VAISAKISNHQTRINEIEEERNEVLQEKKKLADQLKELEEVIENRQDVDDMRASVDELKEERANVDEKLTIYRENRHQLSKSVEDIEHEIKAKEKQHNENMKDIQAKEVQANRLDVTLENHLNHLQTEYVTTFERARKHYDHVEDVEQTKIAVQAIKQEISNLGTVNLGAIEEYDRLLERYTFLEEQKTDLLEAKATLFAVIEEMDTEMIKQFSAMFTDIQVAFTDVFKTLFGGGHAELVLTDKENLLETGIEIIATPPGKKQKALSLLSCGERALTAIALLFAILRVKPVPFCILDEVDASLDEANVARFANYLNQYS